jgi:hypothetical protein
LITYAEVHEWMALINLAILVSLLMLIGLSIFLQRKKKFVWHGNTMLTVMIITSLLTVAHMAPSLVSAVAEALKGFSIVAITGIFHSIIGALTVLLGVWLVGVWAYGSGETSFCAPRKKLMWKILTLWIVSLGIGIFYYLLHISLG